MRQKIGSLYTMKNKEQGREKQKISVWGHTDKLVWDEKEQGHKYGDQS